MIFINKSNITEYDIPQTSHEDSLMMYLFKAVKSQNVQDYASQCTFTLLWQATFLSL